MKFSDLINKDLTINWGKVFEIPEFKVMRGTHQNTEWHKEGNVAAHTRLVCEAAQEYFGVDFSMKWEDKFRLLAACLCHDLGKPTTTYWSEAEKQWKCKDHGAEGAKICRKVFYEEEPFLREQVCFMVEYHMLLHHTIDCPKEKSLNRMKVLALNNDFVSTEDMNLLNTFDRNGSQNDKETVESINEAYKKNRLLLEDALETYKVTTKVHDCSAFVLIGLPGAGKDWYIENRGLTGLSIVSRDDIRKEIGLKGEKPQGNAEEENKVTKIFNERLLNLAKEHKSFVINNTNLRKKYRDGYKQLLKDYDIEWMYIYIEAKGGIETNLKRREGQIPPSIIYRMLDYFEFPNSIEFDNLVFETNLEETEYPMVEFKF